MKKRFIFVKKNIYYHENNSVKARFFRKNEDKTAG